jgi:uncharacterized Zn finger protein (UPF0148 family)
MSGAKGNMTHCPQCGGVRKGEEFKCPQCDVFYSQLDQWLFEEQQQAEYHSWGARLKRIWAAEQRKQAVAREGRLLWRNTPLKTKIVYITVAAFIFWTVMPF